MSDIIDDDPLGEHDMDTIPMPDTDTNDELRPCPFCGCKPETSTSWRTVVVRCSNMDCFMSRIGFNYPDSWNARAETTSPEYILRGTYDAICNQKNTLLNINQGLRDEFEPFRTELARLKAERDGLKASLTVAWKERDAKSDRVRELESALRWIPVGERLPENNKYVLGVCRGTWWGPKYASWWYYSVLQERFVLEFSHWMVMPLPPEVQS